MAIAFDAASNGIYGAAVPSITWNHTCTGSNLLLLVTVGEDNAVNGGTISGVTYNGVAMTLHKRQTALASNNTVSVWYLIAPATGSNAIVVTASVSNFWEIAGTSVSYTGVKQSGFPDAHTESTYTGGTTPTVAVTTVADNCWVVAGIGNRGGAKSAGSGTVERAENDGTPGGAAGQSAMYDNNGVVHPAGSYTLNMNQSADNGLGVIGFSIAPFVPTNSNFFLFMK